LTRRMSTRFSPQRPPGKAQPPHDGCRETGSFFVESSTVLKAGNTSERYLPLADVSIYPERFLEKTVRQSFL